MPAEADRQTQQLRGVLQHLGATPCTELTILSDGADGPRSLGEAASVGPTFHVLDWFHLAMRIQHVAQAVKGWPDNGNDDRQQGARFADAVEHVRWRLWHGNLDGADWGLLWLAASIDEHLWMAHVTEPETVQARDRTHGVYLRNLLVELRRYLIANRTSLTNYGAAYRRGERVATAHVESTVNQVIN